MGASEPGLTWHEGQRHTKETGGVGKRKELIFQSEKPSSEGLSLPWGGWGGASDLKTQLMMLFYSEIKCSIGFYWNARVLIQRQALDGIRKVKDLFGAPSGSFVRVYFLLFVFVCVCVYVCVQV